MKRKRAKKKQSAPFKPKLYAFRYEQLYAFRITQNLSFPQIARQYGCDHSTVLSACRRLGVPTARQLREPDGTKSRGWIDCDPPERERYRRKCDAPEFPIEHGVPEPGRPGRRYPFAEMAVGDSIFVPETDRKVEHVRRAAMTWAERHGRTMKCLTMTERGWFGLRIWRVA